MKVISGTFKIILYKSITVKLVQYHNIIYQTIFDDLVCFLYNLMVKFVLVKIDSMPHIIAYSF
jgi:predicted secreted protein